MECRQTMASQWMTMTAFHRPRHPANKIDEANCGSRS
jgi:hypothetical protein